MKTVFFLCLAACIVSASMAQHITGGVGAADVDSADVLSAAKFVLESANSDDCHGLCSGMNEGGHLSLVKVQSAKTQVVAGKLYKLDLIIADTSGKQFEVSASVWSRPWLAAKNDPSSPANKITELSYKPLDGVDA